MKPVIGVTPDFDDGGGKGGSGLEGPRYFLWERYAASVERGGGIPLMLPYALEPQEISILLDRLDGLIVTGGAFDVDPAYYGESWSVPQGVVKDRRTRFEMAATLEALRRDLPLLGICGGEQNLNVALGGSLYQDILQQVDGALDHERKRLDDPLHEVVLTPDTLLHGLVGESLIRVNSSHHQAVKKLGDGLQVNARSRDGIIEGIESIRHRFVLGVQWHPESQSESSPGCRRIFESFVAAAAK